MEGLTPAGDTSPGEEKPAPDVEASGPKAACQPAAELKESGPEVVGDYELLEEIARGGMGVVYKARQRSLGRVVAVKRILAGSSATRAQLDRFRAEAQAAASLRHPNIVAIHEVGEHQGQPYYSMDYVEGQNLAALVRERPLPPRDAAACVKRIAEAVQYAHAHGIVHRDLKPSNILLDWNDEPRIADFGLAKRLESGSDLTLSGQVLGSPNYLSPEQAAGRSGQAGAASDIYALGAILYHLLTGRPPFQADSVTTLLQQVIETEPVAPRFLNASVPRDLETVCLKCLEKEPQRRYGSARALAEDLGRYLEGQPVRVRPVGWAGKSWRWGRRKPALAGALAGCAALLAIGVAGITWQWRKAVASEEEMRLNLYAADMGLVQSSILENNRNRALRLLKAHRPRQGETDLRGWEWRFLWGQAKSDELETVAKHEGAVTVAKFSPDGRWFATAGWDGRVVVQETATRRTLAILPSLVERALRSPMAIAPDGGMVAIETPTGLDIWATTNWSLIRRLEDGRSAMAFSPDGLLLVSRCGQFSKIRVWDTRTWETHQMDVGFRDPSYFDSKLMFLPHGRTLVVFAVSGFLLRFLDLSNPTQALAAPARGITPTNTPVRPGVVRWLYGHPAGHEFATADRNGRIMFWSLPDLRHLGTILDQPGDVFSLAYSRDGTRLAAAGAEMRLRVYDTASRTNLAVYQGHADEIWSVDFSPDGRLLITGSRDGTCKLWDAPGDPEADGLRIGGGSWHRRGQCWLAPSGRELVVFGTNRVPLLHSYQKERLMPNARRLLPHLPATTAASMDARTVFVQATNDVLEVWDLPGEKKVGILPVTLVLPGRVSFVASPDNGYLYEMSANRQDARLWHLPSGRLIRVFEDCEPNAWGMAFSPDNRLLARGSTNGAAQLWDIQAGRTWRFLPGHAWHLGTIAFSRDGRLVATGSWGKDVYVWETASGRKILGPLLGHLQGVTQIHFSPDGRTLLTGGDENVLRVWHLATGREVARQGDCSSFTLSPDGQTVAVWMSSKLRLMHVPTLAEIDAAP